MKNILSFGVSILSIIVGIGIVLRSYISYGTGYGFAESAGWILAPLGAPTTFLYWFIYKAGFGKGYISSLLLVCFFYLLQYQLIAFLIYKGIINLTSRNGIICLITILVIILISAKIMWNIIMGYWI